MLQASCNPALFGQASETTRRHSRLIHEGGSRTVQASNIISNTTSKPHFPRSPSWRELVP